MQIISQFVEKNGKWYLEVEGKPFLYHSIQSWFPPDGKLEERFAAAARLDFRVFTIWLYWAHLEPQCGVFDFTVLDEMIKLADKYNLRLDIVWAGTNFCDHLDPRFAPEWVLSHHDWHVKDETGECKYAEGFDMGRCCAADPSAEELFSYEYRVLEAMFNYLHAHDVTRRVICIQLENEFNINKYVALKSSTLSYIDRMAEKLKILSYKIALRVNIAAWEYDQMDPDIDQMKHIDAQGIDTYIAEVSYTRKVLNDGNATRFRYIAENAAYENVTSHVIASLACGAFYNTYELGYDEMRERLGAFGSDWKLLPVSLRLLELNRSLNCAPELIASAPPCDMVEFNTENDYMPSMEYYREVSLYGHTIAFGTRNSSIAVGLLVYKEGYYYLFSDGDATLQFKDIPKEATAGYMEDGSWFVDIDRITACRQENDRYLLNFRSGECVRVLL